MKQCKEGKRRKNENHLVLFGHTILIPPQITAFTSCVSNIMFYQMKTLATLSANRDEPALVSAFCMLYSRALLGPSCPLSHSNAHGSLY